MRAKKIITNLDKLRTASAPLEFIQADGTTDKTEGLEIIEQLKAILQKNDNILAIAAPQIGINKRIFCIKFTDTIKTFINPIITKKSNYIVAPETFSSMPGKEILICRPEDITVVYYTDEFKYEDNKLLGPAARLFDQQIQLLDGVLPDELGLISTVETDGSIADMTQEDINELMKIYKKYISIKTTNIQQQIEQDTQASEELKEEYRKLKFTEDVINNRAQVIKDNDEVKMNRAQRREAAKLAKRIAKKGM